MGNHSTRGLDLPCYSLLWRHRLWQHHPPDYTHPSLYVLMQDRSCSQTAAVSAALKHHCPPTWNTFHCTQHINTDWFLAEFLQSHLISIFLLSSAILSMPPKNTRAKNQSSHPGAPNMTPLQLALAGIARPKKKPTMAQQIAALKDELRVAQETILNVSIFILSFSVSL